MTIMYHNKLLLLCFAVLLWVWPPVSSAFLPRAEKADGTTGINRGFAQLQQPALHKRGTACTSQSYALLVAKAQCILGNAHSRGRVINACARDTTCAL